MLSFKNYYGLMAIYGGLTQYTVSRMKLSWKELPEELEENWKRLEALCSPIGNFKPLRELHDNSEAPAIMSPVLFVKDLTMIEEGIETFDPPGTALWNMNKVRKIGKMLRRFYIVR